MKINLTWKIWLLIFVLIGSALLLVPNFQKGVLIKSVDQNSTEYEQGLRTGMIILSVNGEPVSNIGDYTIIMNNVFPEISAKKSNVTIEPVKKEMNLSKAITNNSNNSSSKINNLSSNDNKSGTKTNNTNKASSSTIKPINSTDKIKVTVTTKEGEFILFLNEPPNINIANIPKSRLKTGLDLSGGSRAIVKAENITLSRQDVEELVTITSNRLNTFGIADVSVRAVTDLSGNNFMLVEVAGATTADLRNLLSKQGKFEAKIGNETVFVGGEEDITYVARSGDQAGIYTCGQSQSGEVCNFRFAVSLSEKAAKRHASITSKLGIDPENPEYLDKKIDLYLDDKLVDSLYIGKDLKGSETTQIAISGSGIGTSRSEAYDTAINNMKELQTVLITGSLPYKLEIVKLDTISPNLGKEFLRNIIILAVIVFIMVSLSLFVKYRKIKLTLAVILTMFSEAFITLAIAALIKWNLDATSIAGIIAGMGTGVNDQILIIDEAVSDKKSSLKERIKNAFFVIFSVFSLIVVAMLPLFWAGAGMLKGFALTTIIGVCVGILITRPAFSDIVKYIVKD
jgi:preprotein translocase subunit SecD